MIHVTAGVIVRDGEVLACQRRPGGHHPEKWEFPGGKVEAGETLRQSLRRELREELAIAAEIGHELWRTQHQYAGREPFELVFFLVPSYRGALVNQAFAQVRWVAAAALSRLDFLEGDGAFIAALGRGEITLAT